MGQMGISDAERQAIYMVVAGVLHLGNVDFEEDPESKGTVFYTNSDILWLRDGKIQLDCLQSQRGSGLYLKINLEAYISKGKVKTFTLTLLDLTFTLPLLVEDQVARRGLDFLCFLLTLRRLN